MGRNVVSRKIPLGCVNMRAYIFFVCGPKFTDFFSPNVGEVVVDHLLFRFSICGSVPEIHVFAIEVDSVWAREWGRENIQRWPDHMQVMWTYLFKLALPHCRRASLHHRAVWVHTTTPSLTLRSTRHLVVYQSTRTQLERPTSVTKLVMMIGSVSEELDWPAICGQQHHPWKYDDPEHMPYMDSQKWHCSPY